MATCGGSGLPRLASDIWASVPGIALLWRASSWARLVRAAGRFAPGWPAVARLPAPSPPDGAPDRPAIATGQVAGQPVALAL